MARPVAFVGSVSERCTAPRPKDIFTSTISDHYPSWASDTKWTLSWTCGRSVPTATRFCTWADNASASSRSNSFWPSKSGPIQALHQTGHAMEAVPLLRLPRREPAAELCRSQDDIGRVGALGFWPEPQPGAAARPTTPRRLSSAPPTSRPSSCRRCRRCARPRHRPCRPSPQIAAPGAPSAASRTSAGPNRSREAPNGCQQVSRCPGRHKMFRMDRQGKKKQSRQRDRQKCRLKMTILDLQSTDKEIEEAVRFLNAEEKGSDRPGR
jgi:hypothetical protein